MSHRIALTACAVLLSSAAGVGEGFKEGLPARWIGSLPNE